MTYMNNSDGTRNINYNTVSNLCDSNLTVGWYRFVGAAGTVLSAIYQGSPSCGSSSTGFWPYDIFVNLTGVGQSLNTLYCFNEYLVNACTYRQNITATCCGSYYVFYIKPGSSSNCPFRYCSS